jgi:hypothetical protein
MPIQDHCPGCGSSQLKSIYRVEGVPVHSVQLIDRREAALNYPKGDIHLVFCESCGFIFNQSFDPALESYSTHYESTQAYSPTFNAFSNRLANQLIERYQLHGKKIVEIGCGQGEFLSQLCEIGDNQGVGVDPAYIEGHLNTPVREKMTFIPDYYSEKYADLQADFYCCKMTLEHIQQTGDFISIVRRTVNQQPDAIVFFQIPNVSRILQDLAFWDIYYEHCSYFSLGSLARLFRLNGFDVLNLWMDYDDQYLMIEAKPGDGSGTALLPQENDLEKLNQEVLNFTQKIPQKINAWQKKIQNYHQDGKKVVLWGSGSKGVAFLTTNHLSNEIEYCVDINPLKANTFMAGTGQKVVPPDALRQYHPDIVIVMNPIYIQEVQCQLDEISLAPTVLSV